MEDSNYVVQINDRRWINAIQLNCNVRFVNHACSNNNCELVWLNDKIVGLRLTKNVPPGTFFNFNYQLEYVFKKVVLERRKKCYCCDGCPNYI